MPTATYLLEILGEAATRGAGRRAPAACLPPAIHLPLPHRIPALRMLACAVCACVACIAATTWRRVTPRARAVRLFCCLRLQ